MPVRMNAEMMTEIPIGIPYVITDPAKGVPRKPGAKGNEENEAKVYNQYKNGESNFQASSLLGKTPEPRIALDPLDVSLITHWLFSSARSALPRLLSCRSCLLLRR